MLFYILTTLYIFSQYKEPVALEQLNSKADEFAPVFNKYENRLYFNSDLTEKVKFYICDDIENPKREYLNHSINEISNISYLSFINEDKAIVSSFIKYESQSKLNLFYSAKVKQSWIREKAIDELNGDYFILNATVSEDNSFMIFASNKDNNLKDTDLFITYKNELDDWGEPINISELNSIGSEITPHLAGNDTLYFASNGQGGKGGFDIFMSYKVLGKWQRPTAIDELNSNYNDSDPCLINNKFIFASDRPGGKGKFDLYISEKENVKKTQLENIEYDISFSTFVTNINVKTQSNIKNKAVYPYVHFDENDTKIENSYKERNINTLNSIAAFIKLGNTIELNVWTQNVLENQKEINSKYLSDQRVANIIKYLELNYNISENQIKINYYYSDKIIDYVFIFSKDKFTNITEETNKRILIEPENLVYQLEILPENKFQNYNLELEINGDSRKQILTSKENPLNSKINLKNFESQLSGSDSLKIFVNIKNDNIDDYSKEFLFQINNSYEKISEKNKTQEISFFLISNDDIKNDIYFENLTKEIKDKFIKKEYIIESSFDILDFIKKLESISGLKFQHKINDGLGKEIIIR